MSLGNVWPELAEVFLIILRIYKPTLDFLFVYEILKVNSTHRQVLVSVWVRYEVKMCL